MLLFSSIGNLNLLMRLSTKSLECHFFKLVSRNHFCCLAPTFPRQKRPQRGSRGDCAVGSPHACAEATWGWRRERGALPSLPTEPPTRVTGLDVVSSRSPAAAGSGSPGRAALRPPRCEPPAAAERGPAAPRPGAAPGSRGTAGPGRHWPSCQALRSPAPGEAVHRGRPGRCGSRSGQPRHSSFLASIPRSVRPCPFPARPRRYRHCSIPGAAARSPAAGSRDPRSADAAAAPGARGGRRRCAAAAQGPPGARRPRVRAPLSPRAPTASGPGQLPIDLGTIRELV